MKIKAIALGATCLLTLAACGDGSHAHWGYSGSTGPDKWGKIAPSYKICGTGRNQSPIDITAGVRAALEPITFNYEAGTTAILNNGHTIQVNYKAGNGIVLNGHEYELKQFHFHAPSENHIDGKSYPLEAHFVHADKDGHLAVVGVMLAESGNNAVIGKLWEHMPANAGDKNELPWKIDGELLLPNDRSYYRFNGSLTTPPCSEGVTWLVMKTPVAISSAQLEAFTTVMGEDNNRPLQAINARPILM